MAQVQDRHARTRAIIYITAGVATLGFVAFFGWNLFESSMLDAENQLKSWSELSLNERGDFFAGFFAPLALIWALVAVILQQLALNLQRDESSEQTKIFAEELKNLQKNDLRSHLKSLERQLQRHAIMIREYIDDNFDRSKITEYTEKDVEETILKLRTINKDTYSTTNKSDLANCIDRMCTYVARFDRLRERAEECELVEDFKYYRSYTPYGHLLTTCGRKLSFLNTKGICEGYYWKYDQGQKKWVKKNDKSDGPGTVRKENPIVASAVQ